MIGCDPGASVERGVPQPPGRTPDGRLWADWSHSYRLSSAQSHALAADKSADNIPTDCNLAPTLCFG
jgi:hypothetical protein